MDSYSYNFDSAKGLTASLKIILNTALKTGYIYEEYREGLDKNVFSCNVGEYKISTTQITYNGAKYYWLAVEGPGITVSNSVSTSYVDEDQTRAVLRLRKPINISKLTDEEKEEYRIYFGEITAYLSTLKDKEWLKTIHNAAKQCIKDITETETILLNTYYNVIRRQIPFREDISSGIKIVLEGIPSNEYIVSKLAEQFNVDASKVKAIYRDGIVICEIPGPMSASTGRGYYLILGSGRDAVLFNEYGLTNNVAYAGEKWISTLRDLIKEARKNETLESSEHGSKTNTSSGK